MLFSVFCVLNMGILKGLIKLIKNTSIEKEWSIAYRRTEGSSFAIDSMKGNYLPYRNNSKYWFADPIAVQTADGVTLLFVEAFSRKNNRGEIGIIYFDKNGPRKYQTIIKEEYHMSYPFVFQKDNQWYMIPETNNANRLIVYKAIEFPYQWEEFKTLLDDIKCVDTNIVSINKTDILITYEKGIVNKLVIYKINDDFTIEKLCDVEDEHKTKRGAGQIFVDNDIIIRPSQDCGKMYGERVLFSKISLDRNNRYSEEALGKIDVNDISIQGIAQSHVLGIHTVFQTNDYQFIDYFYTKRKIRNAINVKAIKNYRDFLKRKIKKHRAQKARIK